MGPKVPSQAAASRLEHNSGAKLDRRVAGLNATIAGLEDSVAELKAGIAARDTFIAIATHELRNPITPLIGQVDFLLSGLKAGRYSPEQVEKRLERIQVSIRRYWKRAGLLLDVSRVTRGALQLELEPFDLASLLRSVADDFADAARLAGTSISVKVANTLPGTWDRLAVEQIVDNLLANALKYGDRTPVELSAELQYGRVSIRVRDHGGGVPPEHRERIFGPFERAVGRSERRTGFGIGLWLVCQLAKGMGGDVAVEDAPGGGAMFIVDLPEHVEGTCA